MYSPLTLSVSLSLSLFQSGLVLLVISHGGLLLATNQITPGSVMSFLVATQTIQRSLGNLSVLFGEVVRGMTAGGRVFEVSTTSL